MTKTMTRWLSLSLALLLVFSLVDPLPAVQTVQAETTVQEVYRKPLSEGVQNIVKRAYQMTDIPWTPKKNVFGWKEEMVYFAGVTYRGLPYGQPVDARYVPYRTSLEDFISYVNSSSSKMYTDRSEYVSAPYYSTDCSAFVAWAWGLSSRQTTATLHNYATKISTSSYANAQVGDIFCLRGSHVVLISDITYDAAGKMNGMEIIESTTDYLTNYCCRKTRYGVGGKEPLSTVKTKYLDAGYILYRSKTRDSVKYTHSCVVPLPGDTCSKCADVCHHLQYDANGNCSNCGESFSYFIYTPEAGIYRAEQTYVPRVSGPYTAGTRDVLHTVAAGTLVTVRGSLVNAQGEEWYCITYEDGLEGYVPASAFSFVEYLPSAIRCELQTPREGDAVPKKVYALLGNVYSSRYPLEAISAYLDGKKFAGWKADGLGTLAVSLEDTDINMDLNFAGLAEGEHTLVLRGKDRMHSESVEILSFTFVTKSGASPKTNTRVMFYADGGICDEAIRGIAKGTAVGQLPVPTRAGYAFEGWYTARSGGNVVTADTVLSADTALYARWTPVYHQVNFYFGDQNTAAATIQVRHGEAIPVDQLPAWNDNRYLFAGWYLAAQGGDAWAEDMAVVGDLDLYGHLEPNFLQVQLDANGGTVTPEMVEVTFGQAYGQLPEAIRADYIFAGWILQDEDIWQRIHADTLVSVDGDHTLLAQWVKAVYETEGGRLYFDPETGMIIGCDSTVRIARIPETIDGVTVTGISQKAFRDCLELTQVEIPKTVTNIADWAFWGCTALERITVSEENENYADLDGVLTNQSKTTILRCPTAVAGTYTVPEGVLVIAEHAFYDCSNLEKVMLPASLQHVDPTAFYGCALEVSEDSEHFIVELGVLFSRDMTELVWYPRNKTGIYTVPEGVVTVGADAFRSCRIEAVVLPDSLQLIREGAFAQCDALENVYFDGNAPTLEKDAFEKSMVLLNFCEWNTGWSSPTHEGYDSYMYLRTVPDAITSDRYTIVEGIISGIPEGTTVQQLLDTIYKNEFVRPMRNGQPVNPDALVGTGLVLELIDGDACKDTVTVVIRGDVSGDGKITITDMVAVKSHILKKSTLTGAAALAADTSSDEKITITDFVQIKAHILKKTQIVQ